MNPGSRFDGYATNWAIFGNFGKTAKRSHFGPPRPPESDSQPCFYTERTKNQLIWSILEPFREDFLPNRAKSEPSNLGGTWLWIFAFFQWTTLDFQGSKKCLETSFLDSCAPELQNVLIGTFFRRTDCNFPAVSGLILGPKWPNENPALNVNISQSKHPPPYRRGHMRGLRLGEIPPPWGIWP